MALVQAGTVKVASSTEKQVPAVTSVATLASYLTTDAFDNNARQTVSFASVFRQDLLIVCKHCNEKCETLGCIHY